MYIYLRTTIKNRGVINQSLKTHKKRTSLCMHTIHKLPQNMVNMATRLDIFGIYIQPHFTGYLATLAFAPKTTVTAFCTHFLATVKRVAGLPKHFKVRELLLALNKLQVLLTGSRTPTNQSTHNWRNEI